MLKVGELDKMLREREVEAQEYTMPAYEVPISSLEANLLDFIKAKNMVCADDVKEYMKYKGRNAACARLKKLEEKGFLE